MVKEVHQSQKLRRYRQNISVVPLALDRSDSKEPLLARLSPCSDEILIYDNPGYMSSLEQLIGCNNNSSYHDSTNNCNGTKSAIDSQRNLSRSLDTLKDFLNESSTLPGSVVSLRPELPSDTCTVRDVIIDDSQTIRYSSEPVHKDSMVNQPTSKILFATELCLMIIAMVCVVSRAVILAATSFSSSEGRSEASTALNPVTCPCGCVMSLIQL